MSYLLLKKFLRKSKIWKLSSLPPRVFDYNKKSEFYPRSWRDDQNDMSSFLALGKMPQISELEAMRIRDMFIEYFVSNDSVTWQNKK